MSSHPPIIVVGGRAEATAWGSDDLSGLEWIGAVDGCLARVAAQQTSGQPVRLVAITADVPQPFTTGRRLRSIDRAVGLAFVVPHEDAAAMQTKLALVPDLTDVVVLSSGGPHDVVAGLHQAAADTARRSRLTSALEVMNRNISTTARQTQATQHQGVSERYLAALTRHAPDAIISVDADGRVVASNAAADRILELHGSDVEGRTLEELVRAHDREQLERMVVSVMGGETRKGTEVPVDRADGTSGWLSITAAPVLDEHASVVGGVFLARDITERRRTDERLQHLQRAEAVATMAAGVAHDFNNLLVVVQGWVALAASDPGDGDTVSEALQHIQIASERAAELAQAMLAYGGRAQIDPQLCDVSGLVGAMRRLLVAVIPKTIELEVDLADGLPDVMADASQLQQVVMNLVTNAVEAIGDQTGTIRIRTSRLAPGGEPAAPAVEMAVQDRVVIEVVDSGPGMDERTAARSFDLFFSTKFVGRGLGLATSFGIVRSHGGTLTVDSSPGDGAIFRVILPTPTGATE